jgi:hypothetical protein
VLKDLRAAFLGALPDLVEAAAPDEPVHGGRPACGDDQRGTAKQGSRPFQGRSSRWQISIPRRAGGSGSSHRYPAIRAQSRTKRPDLSANPRLNPISPGLVSPACHAGGRGFESRRSRKVPANPVLLSKKAQTTAGFFGPAHIPHRKIHADSRPEPVIPAPCRAGQIAGGRLAARCKRGPACRTFRPTRQLS